MSLRIDREKTGPSKCGSRGRGCGASIIWAITDNGKRLPVDGTPDPEGAFVLWWSQVELVQRVTSYVTWRELNPNAKEPERWTAHWATCTQRDLFRSTKKETRP